MDEGPTLSHFVTYALWQDASRLLALEIACQQSNRHFRTLSMIYYRSIGSAVETLRSEEYFRRRVANNLFYGLESEFAALPYVVPKAGLGLRNYTFFTYPLRVVYYSVGLYLLRLSQEYVDAFYDRYRTRIHSGYGGAIRYNGDSLLISRENVYYRKYYKAFRTRMRSEATENRERKVIIRLDLQDYYNEISIPRLMALLAENIKPSRQTRMRFDTTTEEEIVFLFRYLRDGHDGIPQYDNSLVSGFIGHLYMIFGDLFLDDILRAAGDVVESYSITRYVDDIYISVKFAPSATDADQTSFTDEFGAQVADVLFFKLGLRLNPKTRYFRLEDDEQKEELLSGLRRVSPEYVSPNDEDTRTPQERVDQVFEALAAIRDEVAESHSPARELRDEVLKQALDKPVAQMLDTKENKARIRQSFSAFDFAKVKIYPLPILVILLKDPETAEAFVQFLAEKPALTTRDCDLIVQYLCQTGFQDSRLLRKLSNYRPMARILEVVQRPRLGSEVPGYFNLTASQLEKLSHMAPVIQQIRYRVVSERMGSHSIALNHLVNEIHAICIEFDDTVCRAADYDAEKVIDLLDRLGVPSDTRSNIRNMFDRRNNNLISHPASVEQSMSGVTHDEYRRFRSHVGLCVASIVGYGEHQGDGPALSCALVR